MEDRKYGKRSNATESEKRIKLAKSPKKTQLQNKGVKTKVKK